MRNLACRGRFFGKLHKKTKKWHEKNQGMTERKILFWTEKRGVGGQKNRESAPIFLYYLYYGAIFLIFLNEKSTFSEKERTKRYV